tara:strand:- start:490 stop:747 length:258 start_codon:yes stop_codon:yes gene_type:complete
MAKKKKVQKITKEELENIVSQNTEYNKLVSQIGLLNIESCRLVDLSKSIANTIESSKKELEAKYGSINIDLQTGEYTEIEKPAEK